MGVKDSTIPGLVWLDGADVAGVATADILMPQSGYKNKKIRLRKLFPLTNAVNLSMRFSANAGASYDAGATDYVYVYNSAFDDVTGGIAGGSGASILMAQSLGNGTAQKCEFDINLFNVTEADRTKAIIDGLVVSSSGRMGRLVGSGVRTVDQGTDAVRFLMSAGNITLRWDLYGWN